MTAGLPSSAVSVVHLDAEGRQRSEWQYTEEPGIISGLAFSGDAVWLNYSESLTTNGAYIRKLDLSSGRVVDTFGLQSGIGDVDVHGDELRLSSYPREVVALDITTGAERWRTSVPSCLYCYDLGGIATTDDDRLWVVPQTSYQNNQILLLDPQHHVIGAGITDELTYGRAYNHLLAWDGDELIVVVRNQIIWLAPPPSI